jgi:YbgC/YbaW family acyl-CoA thioester hydrolase
MREHTFRYHVELYDVNAFGEWSTPALLCFMQQAATQASEALGFGIDWYAGHGTTWIIRRTVVEQHEAARYRDEIAVRTWVSDIRRVRSQREYELHRASDGALLARGHSDWVYVDLRRGLPLQPPAELRAALMPDGVVSRDRPLRKVLHIPAHAFHTQRRVEFAALDSVAHVNNARYAAYVEQDLWDALAAHGWDLDPLARRGRLVLRRHALEYLEEARYRDQIEGAVWLTGVDADSITSEHVITRGGRQLLHATSAWSWQGEPLPATLREALLALAPWPRGR